MNLTTILTTFKNQQFIIMKLIARVTTESIDYNKRNQIFFVIIFHILKHLSYIDFILIYLLTSIITSTLIILLS